MVPVLGFRPKQVAVCQVEPGFVQYKTSSHASFLDTLFFVFASYPNRPTKSSRCSKSISAFFLSCTSWQLASYFCVFLKSTAVEANNKIFHFCGNALELLCQQRDFQSQGVVARVWRRGTSYRETMFVIAMKCFYNQYAKQYLIDMESGGNYIVFT